MAKHLAGYGWFTRAKRAKILRNGHWKVINNIDIFVLPSLTLVDARVIWFHARAVRDRWCEEAELLEEELRRLIRSFDYLDAAWTMIAVEAAESQKLHQESFALSKAEQFRALAFQARKQFEKLSLFWKYTPFSDRSEDQVRLRAAVATSDSILTTLTAIKALAPNKTSQTCGGMSRLIFVLLVHGVLSVTIFIMS